MQNTSKYIYSSQVRLLCLHLCQFLLLCFCRNLQCMWRKFQSLAMQLAVGSQELASELKLHDHTNYTNLCVMSNNITTEGTRSSRYAMAISSVLRARQWRIATCHCRIQKVCFWWAPSKIVSSPMNSHDLPCIILHCYYNILQHSLYCSNSQK